MNDDFLIVANDVESAAAPSRRLDCRIWLLVGEEIGHPFSLRGDEPVVPSEIVQGVTFAAAFAKHPDNVAGVAWSWRVPRFTASKDAADMLLPNNVGHVTWHVIGKMPSVSLQIGYRWTDYSKGHNDAMAMCAAILRGRHAIAALNDRTS